MPPVRAILAVGAALLALAALASASAQGEVTTSRQVRGVVVTEQGNPVGGHWITAVEFGEQPEGHERLVQRRVQRLVGNAGQFTLSLPDGRYRLDVWTDWGTACAVAGYEAAASDPRAITVAGRAIDGLVLVLGGPRPESRGWIRCVVAEEYAATTLRPGLNLAGWTGAGADAAALFKAIPQLRVAYARDDATGGFRWAARDGSGDLTALAPGMALWLALGGTGPALWTRPVLPPDAVGLVPLRAGWNLVTWTGPDGIAAREAFAGLDGVLVEARGWNAAAQRWESYSPRVRLNTLRALDKGSAYRVRVSAPREWWQLAPRLEFLSGFPPARKAALRTAVDGVVAFFAERIGLRVPGLAVQLDAETEEGPCGSYGGRVIYLQERCFASHAHEYVHAILEYHATIGEDGRWGDVRGRYGEARSGPAWLSEATANYWSHVYHAATTDWTYEDRLARDISRAPSAARLRELEGDMLAGGDRSANYSLATLAADWLVERMGEDSLVAFYRERPAHPDWQAAFRAVFGMTAADFYAAFGAYRAEVAPQLTARIRGTAVDTDGDPVEGLWVAALRHPGSSERYFGDRTDAAGAFLRKVEADTYRIHVHSDRVGACTVFSSADADDADDAAIGVADGESVSMRVVVRREVLPEERWSPCDWGGVDATLGDTGDQAEPAPQPLAR